MQAAFAVEVLALEAQVLRHLSLRYAEFELRFAPGAELPAPDGLAVSVRYPLRQAVKFGVVPVNFAVVEDAVDAGQRLVAVHDFQAHGQLLMLLLLQLLANLHQDFRVRQQIISRYFLNPGSLLWRFLRDI